MKRETITKSSGPTAEQMAAALEAAPDYVDDPESPYDPNDALAVEAYWAKARLVMPGQHRFQQHQKQHAMTDKTIADKMYVKNASAIAVLNADARHAALVAQLPPPLMVGDGQLADLVLLFAHSQQELEALLPQAKARLMDKGALWVAYLKGAARNKAEIHRDTIRIHAETLGLDSVAIISMDDSWSALRLKA